jgi:hypothetical protein
MDEWLTIPADRRALPVGRLCVIMALTVLVMIVTQARQGADGPPVAEVPVNR